MKVPARAKVPKTIQRNFFVAHIPSAMVCALSEGSCRQPLPAEGSQKGTLRFPFGAEGAPTHMRELKQKSFV